MVFSVEKDILVKLDKEYNALENLAPIEGGQCSLSSNKELHFCPPSKEANYKELKLFLKNLALKILQENYDEHTKSSSNLH